MKKLLSLAILLSATTLLAGCLTNFTPVKEEAAKRIAFPVFMYPRVVDASPFNITVYERVYKEGGTINIYIEGDGFAWVSRKKKSLDPTPKTPMALKLASMDGSSNVIYIARPCQYTKWQNEGPCPDKYWTSHKYSPIVVNSIHKTLDQIKTRYNASGFNLIGYSGGGAIAALVAADRNDILSLRTVAGNLDIDVHTDFHKVTRLNGSLNPVDIAPKLANIPQRHFIGSLDKNITPEVFYSFAQAMGDTNCLNYSFVANADHEKGWAERWSVMLKEPVKCSGPVTTIDLPKAIQEQKESFEKSAK